MIDGARLAARMKALGISQSELARRVGLTQQSVHKLITGASRGSAYIHKIARELGTTPAYLTNETDDPDEGAPPPPPPPRAQFVMMRVALPCEEALAEMYEAQLLAFGRLQGAELARALAKRLPKALARLQAQQLTREMADDGETQVDPEHPATGRPAQRQAQRT